jgi:hypothetical protein
VDSFVAAGIQCTDATPGDCDDAQCNGLGACDQLFGIEAATFICRADNLGGCDVAETCDGFVGGACPLDVGLGAGVLCRAAVGECDVAETCDATTAPCPADALAPAGTTCSDGTFCNGLETCDGAGTCLTSTDPCAPLICDEASDICVAPMHVAGLEVFYAGRFGTCAGGLDAGLVCSDDNACRDAVCDLSSPSPDLSRHFLAGAAPLLCVGGGNEGLACVNDADCTVCVGGINAGLPCTGAADCSGGACPAGICASSKLENITNYMLGITGIRVSFDTVVSFATTADAAFTFEWTSPTGTIFSPVTDAATAITVTQTITGGATVVDIVLADNHVRQRWLKVSIDATQVTALGVELDGELLGNPVVLPSGNGTPGGDAVFYLGNTPGDVTADRKNTLTDIGRIRLQVNPALRVTVENIYDVDKSVKIQLADVGLARLDLNPAFALPLISP